MDSSIAQIVTTGSNESVRWFCEGTVEVPHPRREWSATVKSRSSGRGCAACSGRAVIVGWNDLATLEPALSAQLVDPSIGKTVTRSSGRSVLWFCEGTPEAPHPRREWTAAVGDRSSGYGCAACSGRAVIAGWNDLATLEPELAAQLVDPSIGQTVTRGSSKPVRWFCDGTSEAPHPRREWTATVGDRSSGYGCAACSGFAVIAGWNDLATLEPELAAQLVDPSIGPTVTRSSGRSVLWFCEGTPEVPHPRRDWSATVHTRSSGNGCAACAGREVIVGWNDLATVSPELAAQLVDPSIAQTVTRSSGRSVLWFCEGTPEVPHPRREWSATVNGRAYGSGCAASAGQEVIVGWNDLATLEPELSAQLVDPGIGQTVTRSSGRSVLWFCEGTPEVPHPRREWTAVVASRSSGNGCAACGGKEVIVGWNDLATLEPELAAQLVDPSIAQTVTRSSGRSVLWFCEGTPEVPHPRREWSAPVAGRSSGHGCAACWGQVVIVGWNDLATTEPELAAQLVDPSIGQTVTRSSGRSVLWFCEGTPEVPHARREWSALVRNRTWGNGCAACAVYGFDPSQPAWLYFLRHDGWDMQQIGVTNSPRHRVRRHEGAGWVLVEIRKFDDGGLCFATERAALAALRLRGARIGTQSDSASTKFDGFTEAWPTLSMDLSGLKELLEWVRYDEWSDSPQVP